MKKKETLLNKDLLYIKLENNVLFVVVFMKKRFTKNLNNIFIIMNLLDTKKKSKPI